MEPACGFNRFIYFAIVPYTLSFAVLNNWYVGPISHICPTPDTDAEAALRPPIRKPATRSRNREQKPRQRTSDLCLRNLPRHRPLTSASASEGGFGI